MDNKNFTIGVLSVTAVILLVGLVIVSARPQRAFASAGPGIEAGDYVLATGQFIQKEHLLYVLDAVAQRLIVYRFDARSRQSFGPTDGIDLTALRERAAASDPRNQQQPRRGRRPRRP